MNRDAWQRARAILCVRLDQLGDVMMCTPAIRALKESLAGARLTLLTSPGAAALAAYIPELDDVIAYGAPWMKHSAPDDATTILPALAAGRFDAAVIFTSYSQSALPAALLCLQAGIGLRLAHCRENPYQLLSDWLPDPEPQQRLRHEVRRQLDLVAGIGCRTADQRLSFRPAPRDDDWARQYLQAGGVDPAQPWILLHPGASAASRRYPAGLWTAVANQLGQRTGYPLLFSGSLEEQPLIARIRQPLTVKSATLPAPLGLGRLAAVIALAPLLIANNTGPVHLAAALGTPVVDLYALTNPQHTPWQVPSRVLFHAVPCGFCYKSICPLEHHDCLRKLAPARIVTAALELLHGGVGAEGPAAPGWHFPQVDTGEGAGPAGAGTSGLLTAALSLRKPAPPS